MGDSLYFTGDEPRYVYYAYSYAHEGVFVGNLDNWKDYLNKSNQNFFEPNNGSPKPGHSVVISFLISPFTKILRLNELRILSVITGVLGAVLLFFLIRKLTMSHEISLFISLITLITIPVLPYLELLYSEIWLFTGVTLASLVLVYTKQKIHESKIKFLFLVPSFFPINFFTY
jgi:hypothetical protein